MSGFGFLRAWGVLALLTWASGAHAEIRLAGPHLRDDSGVEIAVTSLFDQVPQIGFAPVRVWIRNDSGAQRQWTMVAVSGADYYRGNLDTRSRWTFTVDAGTQREFEVVLPLSRASGFHQTSRVNLMFQGYGIDQGSIFFGSTYYGNGPATEFVGLAGSLHVGDWNKLEEYCKNANRSLCGTALQPAFMPTSWQAYSGMGTLWILGEDWAGLETSQKRAVEDWVATGGRLFLLEKGGESAGAETARSHGLGRICRAGLTAAQELPLEVVFQEISNDDQNRYRRIFDQYEKDWDLEKKVGEQEIHAGFVILFMLVFAVLAGPVNLFVLARGKRRPYLFWTTPLLAVTASILLLGMILIQDGTGGDGVRRLWLVLMPEVRQEVVLQEQASKTGLLLERRFQAGGPWWIQPVDLQEVNAANAGSTFIQEGLKWGGDYFRNRSVQGQLLVDVRPSRARLECSLEGGTFSAVNGLPGTIETLWLRDAEGKVWIAKSIATGEKETLQEAKESAWEEFWTAEKKQAVGWRKYGLERLEPHKAGSFYAVMRDDSVEPLATLDAIRWKPTEARITGAWEGEAAPARPQGALE